MNDDDDLGNFFDEINQIEETVVTEQAFKSESINVSVSSNFVASETSASPSKKSATNAIPSIATVISSKPQIVSKPAEITSNPREVYTYGGIDSQSGVEVTSGFIRDAAREIREFTSSATNITSEGLATTSASTSSSKHSGQSIGPIIGPPGPPSGPPPSSYARQKTSGGLNLSLHSYSTSYVTSTAPVAAPAMPKQDKTFVRTGAGEIWVDDSLKDWPENDYRIFVGDLGKETTTEMLAKIFQPYKSFAKAKVIRTKHENKARGFGFVSFMDPMDCAKAIREMQGKYLGTRPMKITRSKWDELDIKQVSKIVRRALNQLID